MAKQRPIRNSELADSKPSNQFEPGDMVFGIFPRQRLPLIVLFFTITLGSFLVWALFSRPPLLDEYTYEIVAEYPHDTTSFTQGLIFRDGFMYESTGHYGQSKIRKIKLDGTVVAERKLEPEYFGEGLCQVGDHLVQLTWKENTGFVYDMDLKLIDEFKYDAQGWGLTFNGQQLIMSDGTSTLYFLNPKTWKVEDKVFVRKGATRMPDINELEYINKIVYANVWGDDMVYMIQPVDGKVVGRINFQKLHPRSQRSAKEAVLNGIALRPDNGNLLITGKNWPTVFEVKLKKRGGNDQKGQ